MPGPDVTPYEYDAFGRLKTASNASAMMSFEYDNAGNLLSETTTGTVSAPRPTVTHTYSYDLEGNMTSRTLRSDSSEITSYAWDAEHHLTEVGLPDGSHVTFRYDPLGNRIEIAHGDDVIRYVYAASAISAEYDGDNNLVATYVHTPPSSPFPFANAAAVADISGTMADAKPNHILEMVRDGQRYFHVVDALGSVTALANVTGSIAERDRYDAYGNLVASADLGNPFAFTGVVREPATNLYLMPLRPYDPTIGRFLSEDPVQSVNLYPYVSNDPANRIDPSGAQDLAGYGLLLKTVAIEAASGAIGGGAAGILSGDPCGIAAGAAAGATFSIELALLPAQIGLETKFVFNYHAGLLSSVVGLEVYNACHG